MAVLTVTQLNRYAAFQLKEDRHLQHLLIRGEISDLLEISGRDIAILF